MPERRILETTQLLGALPPDTLETLRQQATIRTVARNEVLFRQGDDSSRALRHRQRAHRHPHPFARRTRVARRGARRGFAVRRARPVRRRPAVRRRPRARGDATSSCSATTPVRAAIDAHPTLLWVIVRLLARRLRNTDESLADAVFLDVPARTAKRLLEIAGDADEFRLPMTQEDLAGLVGASRERVNKALVAVHPPRLDRGRGPQPLPHPRPPGAARAGHPLTADPDPWPLICGQSGSRKARTRRQASAASSARCAGRSGVVHEPVVGLGVHDDLAVGPVGPRGAQRLDVGRRRERVVRRRRSRASGTRRPRCRAAGACAGRRQSSGTRIIP